MTPVDPVGEQAQQEDAVSDHGHACVGEDSSHEWRCVNPSCADRITYTCWLHAEPSDG